MNEELVKPNFICVGPHKTGTSWLYRTLDRHRQVKTTTIKELDYFLIQDIKSQGLVSSVRFKINHLKRIKRRKLISKNIKKSIIGLDGAQKKLEYHLRILSGAYSLKFYSSFFKRDSNQIIGDISPSYFYLRIPTIKKIKSLYPKLKVFLFLREPLSRISSHVRMMHANLNIPVDEKLIHKSIKLIIDNNERRLYPYHGLNNWLSVFGDESIFIGYYDDFNKDPVEYFKRICRFLKISDNLELALNFQENQKMRINNKRVNHSFGSVEDLVNFRYNPSKMKMEIPDNINRLLCEHYYEDVKLLSNLVSSPYPKKWLNYYDTIIQK